VACAAEIAGKQQAFNFSGIKTSEQLTDFDNKNLSARKFIGEDGTSSLFWEFSKRHGIPQTIEPEMTMGRRDGNLSTPGQQFQFINLRQELHDFSFSARYHYVGEGYKNAPDFQSDQEGIEIRGERQAGPVLLRASFSRFRDNLAQDQNRHQMLTNQGEIAMGYEVPILPLGISFAYSQSTSQSTIEPVGQGPLSGRERTVYGTFNYSRGSIFDATISSSYTSKEDGLDATEGTDQFSHQFSASIQPLQNLTFTPAVGYSEYRDLENAERTVAPTASLSITYKNLLRVIDLSLYGAFSKRTASDGLQDESTLTGSVNVGWDAKPWQLPKMRLSFDFDLQENADNKYPDNSYEAFAAYLSLMIRF
jgi:hypothetical protein